MGGGMEDHFAFLKTARPASLFRLLEKLSSDDAAVALASLPASLRVQVMAYYPENRQAELMPALREARRADPKRSAAVAESIQKTLAAVRNARTAATTASATAAGAATTPSAAKPTQTGAPGSIPKSSVNPTAPIAPKRLAPERTASEQTAAERTAPERAAPVVPPAARSGRPMPWTPKAATSSPINGPALPGKPQVAGDPLKSPLIKAQLMELLGRAREKFLPGETRPAVGKTPVPPARRPIPGTRPGQKPEAREGVLPRGAVGVGSVPRVLGSGPGRRLPPAAGKPAAAGAENKARRMDGKAILAAILRNADFDARENLRRDDPALYRELKGKMFHFDDLMGTADADLARVFTAAPAPEAALALKFAAPVLRDRVLRAVSPGRAEVLRDVPGSRSGLDAIERAQQRILDVALQLQAAGRILIDPRDPDLIG